MVNPQKALLGQPQEKIPLDMLLSRIVTDLYMVFAANGYKKVGFMLLAQELDGEQQVGMAGNLKPDGARALLTNAMEALPEDEDAPKIILPRDKGH